MSKIKTITKQSQIMVIVPHACQQIQNYLLALTVLPSAKAHNRNQKLGAIKVSEKIIQNQSPKTLKSITSPQLTVYKTEVRKNPFCSLKMKPMK